MNDTSFCVNSLSDLFYPHLESTEDLSEHIDHLEAWGKIVLRKTIIENLRRFDDYLMCQVPKTWENLGRFKRSLITVLGSVPYKRRCYLDEYGNRRYLLDEILGIPPRIRIEASAFRWIIKTVANISYEKTARAFNAYAGASITRQTVARCVYKAGDALVRDELAEREERPVSAPVLFVEFDGFWVNLQKETKDLPALPRHTYREQFKKKSAEMKVWTAYAGISDHKRIGVIHRASDSAPDDFFSECMAYTFTFYDSDDIEYLVTSSDAAGWCKTNDMDEECHEDTEIVSLLDRYHINQRIMRAFSAEEDRSEYLGYLYARDFDGFFAALEVRMATEPEDERAEKRQDLYSYIASNLDWLENSSLGRQIRKKLTDDIAHIFADRPFSGHLVKLLQGRRYKRFIATLEKVVARCGDHLKDDYTRFLEAARQAIWMIRKYRQVTLGTMEGTNSKVYAARLKVWGCAWSRRGAIAMMRIRAALFTGGDIPTPVYDAWLSEKEKARIEKWRGRTVQIPEASGKGYDPPRGIVFDAHLNPALYGAVRC